MLRLIDHRPFDRITLREITAEAKLSYPTFFNHYADKDDLFRDLARMEVVDLLMHGFRSGMASQDWRPGAGICAHVAKRHDLWRTLLTAGAAEAMRTEFIRHGRVVPRSSLTLHHNFPIDVVSGIVASGIFEIIAWWLAPEQSTVTAGSVADMLETLVIEPALGLPPGHFTGRGSRAGPASGAIG